MQRYFFPGALVFLLVCGCNTQEELAPAQGELVEYPDQEGWNSIISVSKNGRPAAVIRYGSMRKYSTKRQTEFGDGIQVDFYNNRGQHASMLEAKRGLMNDANSDFEAIGSVVVRTDDGRTLRTERLRWDDALQKIISDVAFTFTRADGDTLNGEGFESDQSLNNWKIRRATGVTGRPVALEGLDELDNTTAPADTGRGGAEQ